MRGRPQRVAPRQRRRPGAAACRARQGDRAAQPSRVVELRVLPDMREGVELPGLRRVAGPAPRLGRARLPPLRPPRARAGPLPVVRVGLDRPPRDGDRAPGERAGRGRPAGLPPRRGRRRPGRRPARASRAPSAASWSAPRWSPRATTSPTSTSGSSWTPTPRCASRTSGPRSGRSRWWPSSPAGRAAGAPAAACSCRPSHRTRRRSRWPPATTPTRFLAAELGRREALRYPPFSTLIRVVCSSPSPGAAHAAAAAVRAGLDDARTPALGPAPLFRLRGRERSQVVVKAADRAAAVTAVGGVVDRLAADRGHREVAFSVDVDPQ